MPVPHGELLLQCWWLQELWPFQGLLRLQPWTKSLQQGSAGLKPPLVWSWVWAWALQWAECNGWVTESFQSSGSSCSQQLKVFPGAQQVLFALGCWCAVVNSFIELPNSFLLSEKSSAHEEQAGGIQTPPNDSNPQVWKLCPVIFSFYWSFCEAPSLLMRPYFPQSLFPATKFLHILLPGVFQNYSKALTKGCSSEMQLSKQAVLWLWLSEKGKCHFHVNKLPNRNPTAHSDEPKLV